MKRQELNRLRRAGIRKAYFSATFSRMNGRGMIILHDVHGPVEDIDHVWIRPEHWHGAIPSPGTPIEFEATIEPYWTDDGQESLGLFNLQRVL